MRLDDSPLVRLELPCRDLSRQRDFYGRVLGLPLAGWGVNAGYRCGAIELVLRPRGDALFATGARGEGGAALLAFAVGPEELDRWHRRMMSARVAVLEPPGPGGAPPRLLRVSDPEGNVVELFVATEGAPALRGP